jgi:hypothetical protein
MRNLELNKGDCGLNAAITTRTNPAIAPPIAGTKGLEPLKAIHQITIAEAISIKGCFIHCAS